MSVTSIIILTKEGLSLMKKIIIGAPHHINDIKHNELGHNSHLFNTSIRPFDFAFKEEETSNVETILNVIQEINSLELSTIQDVIQYPATLESLIEFLKDLNNYQIELNALPKESELNKDIFSVLNIIQKHLTKPEYPSNASITAFLDALDHSQNAYLSSKEIMRKNLPTCDPKNVNLKYSLNLRHEIEAVIQDVIDNNIEEALVAIPNLNSQIALIESTLKRYGLNSNLEDRSVHLSKVQYLSLINFAYTPSIDTLKNVLASNALNLYYANNILFYIEHFNFNLDMCLGAYDYAKDESNKQLIKIQDQIQSDVLILKQFITTSMSNTYEDNIVYCYEFIKGNSRINTQALHNFLLNYATLFKQEHHEYFKYFIEKIPVPKLDQSYIKFVDINALPLNCVEHLYVLNLNGSTYPSVSGKTGLIDELYLSKVTGYPSTDIRTQYSLNQQSRFLNLGKNITLSYSVSSYEGKGLELSYPIKAYCEEKGIKATPWKLHQVIYRAKKTHKLNKDISEQLYLNDGKIVGSISSFELYTQDPMAYFIERGLKLREPELPLFDARVLGTLNHAIVEYMDEEKTRELWNEVFLSYPVHSPKIKMIKLRNDHQMNLNIHTLQEVDASSNFNTMSREKYFISHAIHPKIELRGIIDRIDYTDNKLIIIDYKTSALTLSSKKIMAGQQLQLITYALIAKSLFNKDIMGVFYYGFKLPNIKYSTLKYSAAKGIIHNESTVQEAWIKEKQLSGWFFETPIDEFNSTEYFKSLKTLKGGALSVGTPYNFEMTQDNILKIYDDIQRNILTGILDINDITYSLPLDTPFKEGKEDE